MSETHHKKAVAAKPGLLRDLRLHIHCGPHTSASLAKALKASTATVARALAELRRLLAQEGLGLVSVKEGREWHYELREREDLWENDPLLRLVGAGRGVRRPSGESVDDALYGKVRSRR